MKCKLYNSYSVQLQFGKEEKQDWIEIEIINFQKVIIPEFWRQDLEYRMECSERIDLFGMYNGQIFTIENINFNDIII